MDAKQAYNVSRLAEAERIADINNSELRKACDTAIQKASNRGLYRADIRMATADSLVVKDIRKVLKDDGFETETDYDYQNLTISGNPIAEAGLQ
jgi:hypothetical protein